MSRAGGAGSSTTAGSSRGACDPLDTYDSRRTWESQRGEPSRLLTSHAIGGSKELQTTRGGSRGGRLRTRDYRMRRTHPPPRDGRQGAATYKEGGVRGRLRESRFSAKGIGAATGAGRCQWRDTRQPGTLVGTRPGPGRRLCGARGDVQSAGLAALRGDAGSPLDGWGGRTRM